MLVISCEAGSDWGKNLAKGVTLRLQCVPEDVRPGESAGEGFVEKEGAAPRQEHERAKTLGGFELKMRRGAMRVELPLATFKVAGEPLQPGRVYLWRVAASHDTFGEGPFSSATRVSFWNDVTEGLFEGQMPLWRLYDNSNVYDRRLVRQSALLRTEVVMAIALGNPKAPPALLAAGAGKKAVDEARKGAMCHMNDIAFEDAERPPAEEAPLLTIVGDAEVANGALDLTPLRKGIGLCGAAWYHRRVAVKEGFETEFTFIIKPPPSKYYDVRASDGFAFVLQLDENCIDRRDCSRAIGSSGLQLGFGGLTSCFAVQFATQPSCARDVIKKKKEQDIDGEGDGTRFLCSLLYEPHYMADKLTLDKKASKRSYFYVDSKFEAKECIDPMSGKIFVAPELPPERRPNREAVELSHHCDRVSVQCPGVHPQRANASGPEACMGSARTRELDDGEPHTCRILLEKNRFWSPAVARTDEEKAALEATGALAEGNPTHRLLVYVDDMQNALVNIEIDAEDVFGETLEKSGGKMYAGFTAGTGRQNASHMITSWKFFEVGGQREDQGGDDFFGLARLYDNFFGRSE